MNSVISMERPALTGVSGEFVDFDGERYYAIRNADKMNPFFVSVISNDDHWLFVSSTGGLTAGRISPETALFPYVTVDKIHESWPHTGPKTILRVTVDGQEHLWEPFNREHNHRYSVTRTLYKNVLGNKLCFDETNHDLGLGFRYSWSSSDAFGFVRKCELCNYTDRDIDVALVDGLQNILAAGTPRFTQTNQSNLVDAYKWNELDSATGLALYTLYSGITDRAEPCESLRANVAYSLGLERPTILISTQQLQAFRDGAEVSEEGQKRGIRGAYFVQASATVTPAAVQSWQIVANVELTQSQVVELREHLKSPDLLTNSINESIDNGTKDLARIMAECDAFQVTAEENVSVHHYANVLFNVLRGGVFNDQYSICARDFRNTIRHFNRAVYERNQSFLDGLPEAAALSDLRSAVKGNGDPQLSRLCTEYLPIRFGRRHGDPSRPWNKFSIDLRDDNGNPLLSYEGNWRDIFQNWEALAFSYPDFVENIIAKFVNASTVDGYNPYRITKHGIDWEVEDPEDPWSYIGYWGDHQIIYLQKLLELSSNFYPSRLRELLRAPLFSYANVPYRIRDFDALLGDPKHTVDYDDALAERIEQRVANIGSDGKLLLDRDGNVVQVNLLEKLLVPLLAKLGNLVVDGGIWLNTQRPEWNDANNALVGQGLSMVTLCYMRRYVNFLRQLIEQESGSFEFSTEVRNWLLATAATLAKARPEFGNGKISASRRYNLLVELGEAAGQYRETLYESESFSGKAEHAIEPLAAFLDDALSAIDHSIATNIRDDGLYQAYNTLHLRGDNLNVDALSPMLEGQVAALSTGAMPPAGAVELLENLYASHIYRDDQDSFMLYPDRDLPGFLQKNLITRKDVAAIPMLQRMLDQGDDRIVVQDAGGHYRFNASFTNTGDLKDRLDTMDDCVSDEFESNRADILDLFEKVFDHQSFTGRSSTMFGFEGLGSIYWHMVSKLLLAVQETYFSAVEDETDESTRNKLGQLYYRVRAGLGYNKSPAEYGAFPTDPYSHTPKHSGARQPGMTGLVKEEILTRFGELGIRVKDGAVRIQPSLLRPREFLPKSGRFCYLDTDGNWQDLSIPDNGLAFSWCQVPVVYVLDDDAQNSIEITRSDGTRETVDGLTLSADDSTAVFSRSGRIKVLTVTLNSSNLFPI